MKKIEIALGCIFVLARIFQICSIPGYALLQLAVITGLFIIYILYPLLKVKRTGWATALAAIGIGMAITTYIIGVVFIALHYGVSGWNIFFGGLVFMLLALALLWRKRNKIPNFTKENLIRIGIVFGIGLLSVMLP
ncbi:MAG: hypothetical protein LBQ60_18640 [Bacteroidales bacterium]|jgi:hypothetical protein|nr:hypothetical protein [Bacteroidales bacterium]